MLIEANPAAVVQQDRGDNTGGDEHLGKGRGADLPGNEELGEDDTATHKGAEPGPPRQLKRFLARGSGQPSCQKSIDQDARGCPGDDHKARGQRLRETFEQGSILTGLDGIGDACQENEAVKVSHGERRTAEIQLGRAAGFEGAVTQSSM